MDKTGSLQIGHSFIKEKDFKIKCKVTNDQHVEVPFSHRHLFYAVYWIHEGKGTHVIDFQEYEIKTDRIFFIRPEQVHFLHPEANLNYSALQFTEDFIMPFLGNAQKEIAVYKDMNDAEKARITVLFQQIQLESTAKLPNATRLIQSEINTLLLELERMCVSHNCHPTLPDLLHKYKELIEQNFITERHVQNYASQLSITPNYLNVLTKKYLGKSALDLINERTLLEIKRMLLRTEYDISEIAYKLGFNELSYFSRFFKRHTHMSPLEFRTSMNKMYQE